MMKQLPRGMGKELCSSNLIQGAVGDCWFLGALAMVATRPDLLYNLILEHNWEHGVYEFRFFKDDQWTTVVVDDFLPVTEWGELLLARSAIKGELWIPMLEKAYAKLHGHYQCLNGGSIQYALVDLTGGVVDRINCQKQNGQDMVKQNLLLHKLRQCKAEGWLAGCTFLPSTAKIPDYGLQSTGDLGLIGGHFYTILDIRQVPGGIWLIRVRNPWGQTEWKGTWSDGSSEWSPEILDALNYQFGDDGTFWMSLEDFHKTVSEVNICRTYRLTRGEPFYLVSDTAGRWEGPCACGQGSLKNPQYIITAEQDTSCFVSVMQNDIMYLEQNCNNLDYKEKCLGFWILKCPDGLRCQSKAIYKSMMASPRTNFIRGRSIGKEIALRAGVKYIIMPCQMTAGVEAVYRIYFWSPSPLFMLKTDVYGTQYNWIQSLMWPKPRLDVPMDSMFTFDYGFRGQVFELSHDDGGRDEVMMADEDNEENKEAESLHEMHTQKRDHIVKLLARVTPAVWYINDPVNLNRIHEAVVMIEEWATQILGEPTLNKLAHTQPQSTNSRALTTTSRTSANDSTSSKAPQLVHKIANDVSNALIFDEEIQTLFDMYDKDGSGFITKGEFKELYKHLDHFGSEEPGRKVDDILAEYNMLGDDRVSYEEFAIVVLGLAKR
eukprot:TRINITY_DN61874_c0_g1_i1.p1 TRINITY_DN61874_c0_g1~~TRINITY_DN61874_c0_g1_i1.p1  ORF type:complete len:749 (-),score=70.73 TRINITY_DN61874_c0_g1_i1:1083-3062(-)